MEEQSKYASRPVVYDAINQAIRDMARECKDIQATASLTITAGTAAYTVSSAIGAAVGDILLISGSDWEAKPATASVWDREYRKIVDPESGAVEASNPRIYKVWAGTLTFLPTPSTDETVTVYYTKSIAQAVYTTTIGTTAVEIGETYLTALTYKVVQILAEESGNESKAQYYEGQFRKEFDNALGDRSFDDDSGGIVYHDVTG
jgi:hypothetical protein